MIANRQRIGIALLIVAALLAGCAGGSSDMRPILAMDGSRMDVHEPIEQGRAFLVTGQYGLAVDALSRVLHDQPASVRALNLIAEAYDRLHRYDLADRYHVEALAIDPNSLAALNNWGFSYLVRGDRARAKGLLERAEAIKSDNPVVLANLQLATEGQAAASTNGTPSALAVDDTIDIPISEHVSMVRRTGQLVRLAPGVQLLVTTAPVAPQEQPVSSEPPRESKVEIAPLPYVITQQEPAGVDPRVRNLAALQRLLDSSPFGFFPDVDDFNLQRPAGTASIGQTAYRLAG
jgi:tetratricopeptide (TPR) repeat protein